MAGVLASLPSGNPARYRCNSQSQAVICFWLGHPLPALRQAGLVTATAQATAGRVADAHVLDQYRRAQSAVLQLGNRLGMPV